jgi:hypothetical protein
VNLPNLQVFAVALARSPAYLDFTRNPLIESITVESLAMMRVLRDLHGWTIWPVGRWQNIPPYNVVVGRPLYFLNIFS